MNVDEATACSDFRSFIRKAEKVRIKIVVEAMKNRLENAINLHCIGLWGGIADRGFESNFTGFRVSKRVRRVV